MMQREEKVNTQVSKSGAIAIGSMSSWCRRNFNRRGF